MYYHGDTYQLTTHRRLMVTIYHEAEAPEDDGTPPTEVLRHPGLFNFYGGGDIIGDYGDTLGLGEAMQHFHGTFRHTRHDWKDVLTRYASIFHGADILLTEGNQSVQGSEFIIITEVTDDWREIVGTSEFYQPSAYDAVEILAYHSGNTYLVTEQSLIPECLHCGHGGEWKNTDHNVVFYGDITEGVMREMARDFR